MTLPQFRAWCLDTGARANERIFHARIQRALLEASVWVQDLQDLHALNEDQILISAETGETLLEVLDSALAAGVPERTIVERNGRALPLTEVRALGESIVAIVRRP